LNEGRTPHRVHDAFELDEHTIARRLDDPAAVGGDGDVDKLLPEPSDADAAFFIVADQPAVPGDVRGQDSRQAPTQAVFCHASSLDQLGPLIVGAPGDQQRSSAFLYPRNLEPERDSS
jgi:hypothetical protein